jgi:predicted outer membrane lipoprotein
LSLRSNRWAEISERLRRIQPLGRWLKLANAFGVFNRWAAGLKLANAFGVFNRWGRWLKLANAFGVLIVQHHCGPFRLRNTRYPMECERPLVRPS